MSDDDTDREILEHFVRITTQMSTSSGGVPQRNVLDLPRAPESIGNPWACWGCGDEHWIVSVEMDDGSRYCASCLRGDPPEMPE